MDIIFLCRLSTAKKIWSNCKTANTSRWAKSNWRSKNAPWWTTFAFTPILRKRFPWLWWWRTAINSRLLLRKVLKGRLVFIEIVYSLSSNLFKYSDGIEGTFEDLCANPLVEKKVLSEIQKHLMRSGRDGKKLTAEIPRAIKLLSDVWTPETGLVTAGFKVNRKNIQTHYQQLIDHMYQNNLNFSLERQSNWLFLICFCPKLEKLAVQIFFLVITLWSGVYAVQVRIIW